MPVHALASMRPQRDAAENTANRCDSGANLSTLKWEHGMMPRKTNHNTILHPIEVELQ